MRTPVAKVCLKPLKPRQQRVDAEYMQDSASKKRKGPTPPGRVGDVGGWWVGHRGGGWGGGVEGRT